MKDILIKVEIKCPTTNGRFVANKSYVIDYNDFSPERTAILLDELDSLICNRGFRVIPGEFKELKDQ